MSIRYMRNKVTAGDPFDADGVSDTLQDFASEIDGKLGEQNWDETGFTSLSDDMETDAVSRLDHYAQSVDWTTLNGDGEPAPSRTNAIRCPMTLSWSSLIRRSFTTCRGGTYRVVCSFQLDAGSTSNDAEYWTQLVGYVPAFRINGVVPEESIAGGVERSNDSKGEGIGWDIGAYTMTYAFTAPPGNLVVELVGRPARATSNTATWEATSFYEINNHEMWVEEDI